MLEAVLARMNGIAPSKRTAFQSRLKNFHRLGFPIGFKQHKGKAALYDPAQAMMMALAIELTQLGLSPELVVRALALNYVNTLSVIQFSAHRAVSAFKRSPGGIVPEDRHFYIAFDPCALSPLSLESGAQTTNLEAVSRLGFKFVTRYNVGEQLGEWTTGDRSRISLLNVSSLAERLIEGAKPSGHMTPESRLADYQHLNNSAKSRLDLIGTGDVRAFGNLYFISTWASVIIGGGNDNASEEDIEAVAQVILRDIERVRTRQAISGHIKEKFAGKVKGASTDVDPEA